jgi:glutathione S-transferase
MLTLYLAPGSSSFAVHIALHEIGVPFEGKPMSFKKNDLRSPGYLKLNPEGKVPTLLIDGRPLTEVAAILYYLAKRFPDAGLLPREDIEAEAQALSWMSFIASTLHPARRRGLDYANEVYAIADRRLGSGWAAKAGYPVRRSFSILTDACGYWVTRFRG